MKCYDSSEESKFIMHLDANNLYGWAMVSLYHIVDLNGSIKKKLVGLI